ncbi:MAG: HK97 family phage prohead protease [Rhodobacteraceae bacterium]|nr:HK97 family phage prohead protease [Paracoccaceae bacterium]
MARPVTQRSRQQGRITITGYASLFDQPDASGDVVRPGAFRRSLRQRGANGIAMLWQHDPARPVGVWTHMSEDRHGLRVIGQLLPDVAQSREAAHLIASGALSGLSIGFQALKALKAGGRGARTLIELDLWEVSLVTFPQMDKARVRLV